MVEWWALSWKRLGAPDERVLFAIPNGGHRHVAVAAKLKAEGVRPGIPDIHLAQARGGFFGLWIEMKRVKGGGATDDQASMLHVLRLSGYNALLCRGADEAIRAIEAYMRQPPEQGWGSTVPPLTP